MPVATGEIKGKKFERSAVVDRWIIDPNSKAHGYPGKIQITGVELKQTTGRPLSTRPYPALNIFFEPFKDTFGTPTVALGH